MRILGIDPGIARTGWGVVDSDGHNFEVAGYGCLLTPKEELLPVRLLSIYKGIGSLVDRYSPDLMGVEQIFFARNVKTAIAVGHARGVCLLVGGERGISVEEVTPLQVKSFIVGYGNATKEQVGIMIKSILGLPLIPEPDDVCDALAIAVSAGIKRSFGDTLERSRDIMSEKGNDISK
ncbi:MAG: crossover junction endodeoxyribonuclease RuvC [Firmicutes bacterium]|nr:crossover junction endodeoxyribonuclease RuvC [Candidatus Fermentithermobacillaceae bacterium]